MGWVMNRQYVVLRGGLGNQMSQYAFFLNMRENEALCPILCDLCRKREHGGFQLYHAFYAVDCEVVRNAFLYTICRILIAKKKMFLLVWLKKMLSVFGVSVVDEDYSYAYDKDVHRSRKGMVVYVGGWHNDKYFCDIDNKVRKAFSFRLESLSDYTYRLAEQIKKKESVAIHIRRGDYGYGVGLGMFGGVCTVKYYQNAISEMRTRVPQAVFYVFSDDFAWVKAHLGDIGFNVSGNRGRDSWQDMYLMSICKHNIISNSSFSWWGAWLNSNVNKVVLCPSKFIASEAQTDVYPDSWTKVSSL